MVNYNTHYLQVYLTNGSMVDTNSYTVGDNNWHQYAGTYDSSSGQMFFYVDGILRGSATTTGQLLGSSGFAVSSLDGRYINGSADEIRVWNRALSAQEIAVQYASDLYKYNNNTWYFSNNNANLSTGGYSYVLYTNSSNNGPTISMVSDLRTVHVCMIPFVPC